MKTPIESLRDVAKVRSDLASYREDDETSRDGLIEGIDIALDALADILDPHWEAIAAIVNRNRA